MKTYSTTAMLVNFVQQRPNLEFANYGDIKYYRQDSREITNDRNDFFELLRFAQSKLNSEELELMLFDYLKHSSRRLTANEDGSLRYITGQYFPTEYRAAACSALASMLWDYVRENYEFKTGEDMRKYFRRNFGRRVCKNYFN